MSQDGLQKLVIDLDILIRARYPLIAANTHEEGRFRRVVTAVANLKTHKDKDKPLFVWSRTMGLRQIVGKEAREKKEAIVADTDDPISVLEFIAKQEL